MRIDDPAAVRAEYASERGLSARRAVHLGADGPNAVDMVFSAVAEVRPQRILEVGCGTGELAARLHEELPGELVALDQSPRMVELTRLRGVETRVGDVQALPFKDAEFDCVVAAWMLYHAGDVELALDEIVRVLTPTGRFVAATNYADHFRELRELIGASSTASGEFHGERAKALLKERFSTVEARDAFGTVTFADRDAVRAYVEPSAALFGPGIDLPELDGPLVVRRRAVVLVATR